LTCWVRQQALIFTSRATRGLPAAKPANTTTGKDLRLLFYFLVDVLHAMINLLYIAVLVVFPFPTELKNSNQTRHQHLFEFEKLNHNLIFSL